MIARILPYPLLTLSLIVFWMTLNKYSLGHLILGSVVAMIASLAMAALRPVKPKFRRWYLLPKLIIIVFFDVIRSNISVAQIILFQKEKNRKSGFLNIPLEMKHPMGLATLAIILTSTPGSAWLEYNSSQGTLLLHVLDNVDETAWTALIKNRYEKLLMEIFE
jgi:multicomponent K+:H+ antiporter subunit E